MGTQRSRGGDPEVPTGVSMTALGVAAARATESARPDRLFEDSLAKEFVAAAGPAFEEIQPQGSDLDPTGFAPKLQATTRRGGLFITRLPLLVFDPQLWCKASLTY